MPKKISIVTGPIVRLQSTRFIEETIESVHTLDEKTISFDLFVEILEQTGPFFYCTK